MKIKLRHQKFQAEALNDVFDCHKDIPQTWIYQLARMVDIENLVERLGRKEF